jgi:phosphoribosyl 1,2-cyclic phosphodiesterase
VLVTTDQQPVHGHLLITHTHWDHIQGLPFFAPLFVPDNEWDIYAPRGFGQPLRDTLAGQMQYTYFPITLEQLGANIRYHELVEGAFQIADITVRTQYLNHPALALGYRPEADGLPWSTPVTTSRIRGGWLSAREKSAVKTAVMQSV